MPDVPLSSEMVTSGHYMAFSSAKVNDSAMSLTDAAELARMQAAASVKQRRRKCIESAIDEDDSGTCDGLAADDRCDCCSVLTHQKAEIHSTDNIADSKLTVAFGRLLWCLLLLLLFAVLLLIICSMKPGWCRLGLPVDWRLQHVGGSPPV